MGRFFSMSGIAKASKEEVEKGLLDYLSSRTGELKPIPSGLASEDNNVLLIADSKQGNITVLYAGSFTNQEEASAHLSIFLDRPVFFFHTHDDDLWMYVLYVQGQAVDRFNTIPNYWDEDLSEMEMHAWAGDASVIAKYWPSVQESNIKNYLVHWKWDEDYDGETKNRAYPEDQYAENDFWQISDFLAKLDLTLPIEDNGTERGSTYNYRA